MTNYFWSSLALFVALLYSSRTDAAPPAEPTGCKPLYGVSYDPFSTSGENICLSSAQVAIDVAIMATVAKSIRIYSIAVCPETTSTLLEESRKHNMTVLMGILINANAKDISAELSYLPKIMANYSDVVQAVSVGNQALTGPKIGSKSRFASTMSNVELLTGYIRRVRSMLRRRGYKHPVTTAETWPVWESSNGYPLSSTIDFICLNMSPFYEGFEAECLLSSKGRCTTASKYATGKADGLAEYFGQDVWVCETSWPTEGNSCCTGLQAYQQKGNKAKASASTATKYLNDFAKRAGDSPYYISSAFDKDWRRVWGPCPSCSEKNLHLSSFRNGICDLCEEEYQLGLFDQYRERKESYELPRVRCELPSLPETRLAVDEPTEEAPTVETTIKVSGETTKTKKGETKTVVRSSATTSKKEPVSKTKTDSKTIGEEESSTTAKTKATTKTSKSSATAKATSVVETSNTKTTKTTTSKTKEEEEEEDDDDVKDDEEEDDDKGDDEEEDDDDAKDDDE